MLFLNSITDDWWSILIWGLVPSVSYNDLWVFYTSFFGKILLLSLFYVLSYFRKVEVKVKVSCSVVSNSLWPHGLYSLPGSFVHGIFQPRTLEWVAISFPRGSAQPRARTWVSHIADGFFTVWDTRKALSTTVPLPMGGFILGPCLPQGYQNPRMLKPLI